MTKVECWIMRSSQVMKQPSLPLPGVVPRCWPLKIQQNGFTVLVTNIKQGNYKKIKNNDTDEQACDAMKRKCQPLANLLAHIFHCSAWKLKSCCDTTVTIQLRSGMWCSGELRKTFWLPMLCTWNLNQGLDMKQCWMCFGDKDSLTMPIGFF